MTVVDTYIVTLCKTSLIDNYSFPIIELKYKPTNFERRTASQTRTEEQNTMY